MGLERLIRSSVSSLGSILSLTFGSKRREYEDFFGVNGYHPWFGRRGYIAVIKELKKEHPGRIVEMNIGYSTGQTPMLATRISADTQFPKPYAFMFTGMIHAREFIGGEACLHIAQRLLEDYNAGEVDICKIMNSCDIFVLPVLNPDSFQENVEAVNAGRVFGWLKRKNQNGIDLNRNFDDNFEGRSWTNKIKFPRPFNEEYAGTHPFSEKESQVVRDFVMQRPHIIGAMNFHSVSNVVLYQPGSSQERHDAQRELAEAIGDSMGYDAVQMSHFLEYVNGAMYPINKLIRHPTVEGSLDGWLYQTHGISSFLIEIGSVNFPLLLSSHLAGYNPPPHELPYHVDKCYKAAKRMMLQTMAQVE